MKRILALFLAITLITSVAIQTNATVKLTGKTKNISYGKTPVGKHGRLRVKGKYLVDKKGKKFQIKGISTHGINWDVGEPFVNEKSFKNLRDEWGANCVRVAMYTEEYNGYCITDAASRKKLLATIDKAVKATKKLGMYVIIDWHILNDYNPNKNKAMAKKFFKKMASKYGKYKNVLFEICNEPNGGTSWSEIKKYAKTIIKVIRKKAKKTIIIVGTPTWSQDVDVASYSPIKKQKNIMYTLHFYAATHKDSYIDKAKVALKNKLPIFCTEFSGTEASGDGYIDKASLKKWIKFLKKNYIGMCAWSLSNKPEKSALLKSTCKKTSGYKTKDLSDMGKLVTSIYN